MAFLTLAPTLKGDTVMHSWEILGRILSSPDTSDIVCDVGM